VNDVKLLAAIPCTDTSKTLAARTPEEDGDIMKDEDSSEYPLSPKRAAGYLADEPKTSNILKITPPLNALVKSYTPTSPQHLHTRMAP